MILTETQKIKKLRGFCISRNCSKRKVKGRTLCHMHRMRRVRETNPIQYVFNNLRCNAKRRGKEFNLTLREFRNWIATTDYMKRRGKTADSLSIDRIDNSKGYKIGNLQIVTLSYNSRKSYFDIWFEEHYENNILAKVI